MTMLFAYYQYTEQASKQTFTFIFDYLFIYFLVMTFHLQIQSLKTGSGVLIAANEKNGGYFNFLASFYFEGIIFDFLYYSFVFIF